MEVRGDRDDAMPSAQTRQHGLVVGAVVAVMSLLLGAAIIDSNAHAHARARAAADVSETTAAATSDGATAAASSNLSGAVAASPSNANASATTAVRRTVSAVGYTFAIPDGWTVTSPVRNVDLTAAGQPIPGTNSLFDIASADGSQQLSVVVSTGRIGEGQNHATPPNEDAATRVGLGSLQAKIAQWTDIKGGQTIQLDTQAAPQTHITMIGTGLNRDQLVLIARSMFWT